MENDTQLEWLKEVALQNKNESFLYQDRAFFEALANLSDEVNNRLIQKQGELDGRIWNHDKW